MYNGCTMLVSSHTVSVWHDWKFTSKEIFDSFPEHNEGDLIVFIPKVVETGIHLPEFLKLLNVGEGVELPHGTAYVGKGKLV